MPHLLHQLQPIRELRPWVKIIKPQLEVIQQLRRVPELVPFALQPELLRDPAARQGAEFWEAGRGEESADVTFLAGW